MSDWFEKVHAHADGELDKVEKAEVEAVLARDPRAAAEHQWAVYLKELLYSKHLRVDHSEVWQRGRARLDAIDALTGNSQVESFVGRFSWGFAAALFAVIVFAGLLSRGAGQISDQQLAGLFMANTTERSVEGTSDADNFVRRETGSALPQIESLIEVTSVGKGTVEGREFLKVDLHDNSGAFELYIFQGANRFESLEPISGRTEFFGGTVNNLACVAWSKGGATYILVAPRTTDEVVSMADRMRR
jgi:hypothetical protein